MIQRQLPPWARLDHPALRYALGVPRPLDRREQYARAFFVIIGALVLAGIGLVAGSDFLRDDLLQKPISDALISVLFWPVFIVQVIARLSAMAMTIGTIGEEKRRQTWDSLRTTTIGPSLAVRARWSAVLFYKMRSVIGLLLLARLILIAAILFDLTAFSGEYLGYLTDGVTPRVPVAAGVLLLALTMTASLLLPVTGLGVDAALGLLVSTSVRQRIYVLLTQVGLTLIRLAVIGILLAVVTEFRTDGMPDATHLGRWLLVAGFAALGDWGLSLLHLHFLGTEVWGGIPYAIFLGPALLVFVFLQTLLTDLILALAVRQAERSE